MKFNMLIKAIFVWKFKYSCILANVLCLLNNFWTKFENSYHSAVVFKVVKKISEIKYFDAKIKAKIWQYVLLFCNFSDFTM